MPTLREHEARHHAPLFRWNMQRVAFSSLVYTSSVEHRVAKSVKEDTWFTDQRARGVATTCKNLSIIYQVNLE